MICERKWCMLIQCGNLHKLHYSSLPSEEGERERESESVCVCVCGVWGGGGGGGGRMEGKRR